MRSGELGRSWRAALGLLAAVGALSAAAAADRQEGEALVDERFDAPRPIPVLRTYDQAPAELLAQAQRGEPWHLIVEPGSTATAEVKDGAAVVRIERAGMHWYAVQLAYLPVRIQPGRGYRVTFRARADRTVFTTFDLAHVGGDWHSYSGRKELDLGTAWRKYEVAFTTTAVESDPAARFEFNFGDETGVTVTIDDVRLVETPLPGRSR